MKGRNKEKKYTLSFKMWVKEDENNLLDSNTLNLFNLFLWELFVLDSCRYTVAPRWETFSTAPGNGRKGG